MKRLLAEVPDEFFWEVKKKTAELQLTQKTIVTIAVRQFIGSTFPLEDLIDVNDLARLAEIGIN